MGESECHPRTQEQAIARTLVTAAAAAAAAVAAVGGARVRRHDDDDQRQPAPGGRAASTAAPRNTTASLFISKRQEHETRAGRWAENGKFTPRRQPAARSPFFCSAGS
jgi:hypothetical protein